jgi:hypothetical protein
MKKIVTNLSKAGGPASALIEAAKLLAELKASMGDYIRITQEEKTKRAEIKAWENIKIEEIRAKRDLFITYLDKAFTEREKSFDRLFDQADEAMRHGDAQQLGAILSSITELAKTTPFKDLVDYNKTKEIMSDPDHKWNL